MSNADLNAVVANLRNRPPRAEVETLLAPPDEWAVSLETAQLLFALIEHAGPQSVLEFGAGRSSLVVASALQSRGGGRLTSIEHQPAYAEGSWRQMTKFPAVDARLVPAPLNVTFSKHGLLHEYGGIDAALSSRGPFDFVFIDAPPGELGRDAPLLQAAPYLRDGAIVVLDDATRPREQTAIGRWTRALKIDRVFESDALGRGIAVLQVRQPQSPAFSLRTFVGTIHDRIVERRFKPGS